LTALRLGLRHNDPRWFYNLPRDCQVDVLAEMREPPKPLKAPRGGRLKPQIKGSQDGIDFLFGGD